MNIKKLLNPKCSLYALFLFLLKTRYNFDEWHWKNNYWCRKYKRKLVKELNKLPINNVAVELGGGLGEIIGRLKTKRNILIDLDEAVLKASEKILFLKITDRIKGSWEIVNNYAPEHIDIFISINWIHGLSPQKIEKFFKGILKEKTITFIVVDRLITPWEGSYKHDFSFLKNFDYHLFKRFDDGGEGLREFLIFQKIKS